MARFSWAFLTAGWLIAAGMASAADPVANGNYKFSLVIGEGQQTLWLLKLDNKDGQLTGEVLSTRTKVPPGKLTEVSVKGEALRMAIELKGIGKIHFEGKVPSADGKKILGVFIQGTEMLPAQLELTTLTSLDSFELSKDTIARANPGPEIFDAVLTLLGRAAEKEVKIEDVRNWASKGFKAAEAHGALWQREMGLRIADVLAKNKEYAPVAVFYARQSERLLQPTDKMGMRQRTLTILAAALTKAGKEDEAKEVTAQIDKLEPVTLTKFGGRKGDSDRTVLVELFTGAECPPCVGADLAFDALGKTFKGKDVVFLQYHLHIPGPDPLTNTDTEARRTYYADEIEGTPTIFFNGKAQDFGGGGIDDAQDRYSDYMGALAPILEKTSKVKLKATATQKGSKIDITAEANDVAEPGERVRLRLALVEEQVKYKGGNKLAHHHWVVRALPGGAAGLPLKEKTGKQTASVDLDELRKKLGKYLDDAAKDLDFPNKERPMDFKKLRVVAFVQNDSTKEVLQATHVDILSEKEGK